MYMKMGKVSNKLQQQLCCDSFLLFQVSVASPYFWPLPGLYYLELWGAPGLSGEGLTAVTLEAVSWLV